jgi:hypothetical protein
MTRIVASTPVAANRGDGTFSTIEMSPTTLVFLVRFRLIDARDAFETSMIASFFVTGIVVSTPMAPARRRRAFDTRLVGATRIIDRVAGQRKNEYYLSPDHPDGERFDPRNAKDCLELYWSRTCRGTGLGPFCHHPEQLTTTWNTTTEAAFPPKFLMHSPYAFVSWYNVTCWLPDELVAW